MKQARAEKGVTLKEVEQATRINRHHLAALEEENFAVLPPPIYRRGIIRNYSAFLDIDPGKALAMYTEASGEDGAESIITPVRHPEMPRTWAPNFAIIAFMVVMSAIVFAWIYSISFKQPASSATLPPSIPTVTPIPEDRLPLPSPTVSLAQLQPQQPVLLSPASDTTSAVSVQPGATGGQQSPIQQGAVATVKPLQSLQTVGAAAPTEAALAPTPIPAPTSAPQVQQAPAAGQATIRVLAQGDINVTVVADGATVFSGWLGAGGMTDWYSAGNFAVTTSDGSLTMFE
ncbi:MAG: helix-turn-helix domain-containing protein, partial [Thermomicrobiales bacterium]